MMQILSYGEAKCRKNWSPAPPASLPRGDRGATLNPAGLRPLSPPPPSPPPVGAAGQSPAVAGGGGASSSSCSGGAGAGRRLGSERGAVPGDTAVQRAEAELRCLCSPSTGGQVLVRARLSEIGDGAARSDGRGWIWGRATRAEGGTGCSVAAAAGRWAGSPAPGAPVVGRRRAARMGSPVSFLGGRQRTLGFSLPADGCVLVASRGAAPAAEVGRHRGCPVGR